MSLTVTPQEIVSAAEASSDPGLLGRHDSWSRVELSQIAEVVNGAAFPSRLFNNQGLGMPLVRIRDIEKNRVDTYYSGAYDPLHLVRPGDMLLGMDGDFRVSVWQGPEGLLNQRVCKLIIRQEAHYDRQFLVFVLQGYLDAIWRETSSVTVKHLSSRSIGQIPLPLPPLDEQRRVATALEHQVSRLESGREAVDRIRAKTHSLHACWLDQIISGRALPGPQTFDRVEAVSELIDAQPKKMDYGSLPGLPRGWRWRAASDACEAVFCGSTPDASLMHSGTGDIPFLKVYNILKTSVLDPSVKPTFIDRATHEGLLRRSKVRPGDVLTNIVGPPLGKTAVVPSDYDEWNINQAIVGFRAGPLLSPTWLAFALRSKFVLGRLEATAKATAGQLNVALSACRELPIPVPPTDVQEQLVQEIDQLVGTALRLSDHMTRTGSRVPHLRTALLRAAFSGNLVPQDPHDEPGDSLLRRIRMEREQATKPKRGRTPKAFRGNKG